MAIFRFSGKKFFPLPGFQEPHPFYRPLQLSVDFAAPSLLVETEHIFVEQGGSQLFDVPLAVGFAVPVITVETEHVIGEE